MDADAFGQTHFDTVENKNGPELGRTQDREFVARIGAKKVQHNSILV